MVNILSMLQEHQTVMSQVENLIPLIVEASERIILSLRAGGKVFFMGNGGSAADAQHLAAEFIGRFKLERKALPGIALTTDSSVLTSLSNDYDFSVIFSRQLEALCQPMDVVVGISTSGNSPNVIKGFEAAKKIGAYTIGLTGHVGNKLSDLVNLCFCIPSTTVARIQEGHLFIGHVICEYVENAFVSQEVKSSAQSVTEK